MTLLSQLGGLAVLEVDLRGARVVDHVHAIGLHRAGDDLRRRAQAPAVEVGVGQRRVELQARALRRSVPEPRRRRRSSTPGSGTPAPASRNANASAWSMWPCVDLPRPHEAREVLACPRRDRARRRRSGPCCRRGCSCGSRSSPCRCRRAALLSCQKPHCSPVSQLTISAGRRSPRRRAAFRRDRHLVGHGEPAPRGRRPAGIGRSRRQPYTFASGVGRDGDDRDRVLVGIGGERQRRCRRSRG